MSESGAISGAHEVLPPLLPQATPLATSEATMVSPQALALIEVAKAALPPWARNTFAAGVLALAPLVYGAFVELPALKAKVVEQSTQIEQLRGDVRELRAEVLSAIKRPL